MAPGMAAEPLEVRMARLEGAYEQVDRRLVAVEAAIEGLRAEIRDLRNEVRQEISDLRNEMRQEVSDLRREMRQQFFWLLGVLVVAILVQIALRYLPGP